LLNDATDGRKNTAVDAREGAAIASKTKKRVILCPVRFGRNSGPFSRFWDLGVFMTFKKKLRLLRRLEKAELFCGWAVLLTALMFPVWLAQVPKLEKLTGPVFAIVSLFSFAVSLPVVFAKITKRIERRMDEVRNEPENWLQHLWRSDYDRDIKKLAEAEMDELESQLDGL
jgi:hypothetical protein